MMYPWRKAVIDIGSNSIRLLVAEVYDKECYELHRDIKTTRLGRGIQAQGKLSEKAIEDTVQALLTYWNTIKEYRAELVAVVATSAVREASNSSYLLQRINTTLSFPVEIEIINGYREAELTYKGSAADFGHDIQVFDLGGGSLELIPSDLQKMHSIPFGAVKAAELFGNEEGKISFPEQLNNKLSRVLMDAYQGSDVMSELTPSGKKVKFVGVGGTATYLVKAHKRLSVYNSELIHGSYMDLTNLTVLLEEMNECKLQDRARAFYLPENRADIIVAGGYIIKYLLQYLGIVGYYASDSDILKGLILESINN